MVLTKRVRSKLLLLTTAFALTFTSILPWEAQKRMHLLRRTEIRPYKHLTRNFGTAAQSYFWKNSNRGSNYMDFWIEAELWETVMDAYLHTSDAGLKAQLRTQIDDIFDGTVAKYGEDWTNNHFNDDIMWWAMGSARAYEITKNQKYLDKAKYYFDFVYNTQWDDSFANGGIWWMNTDHSTKNACINFPAAEAAVYLYNITKDDHYLDAATRITDGARRCLRTVTGKCLTASRWRKAPSPMRLITIRALSSVQR